MKYIFILLSFILTFLTTDITFAEDKVKEYESMTGLTGLDKIGNDAGSFGEFVNFLVQWSIGLAAALAVITIMIGGLERMTHDSIQKQSDGRKRIEAAIWGLLIALSSYLLLATINPKLLNLDINIDKVDKVDIKAKGGGVAAGGGSVAGTLGENIGDIAGAIGGGGAIAGSVTGAPSGGGTVQPSGTIGNIPSGINIKPGVNNQIDSALVPGLSTMKGDLQSKGINWQVTEGYPPKYTHVNTCHQNGTCIDANFTGDTAHTVANINAFIDSARKAGFNAVYEVDTQAEADALKAQGVKNVISASISAPHFSVYGSR